MKPITSEWVAKAEGDFATLERECHVDDLPNYDGICFHAQPGESADQAAAKEAQDRCNRFRKQVRQSLRLKP
jgi:hypothetical protein